MQDKKRLRPSDKEIALYNKMFSEAAFRRGTEAFYASIKSRTLTTESSEVYEWNDYIPLDIIYEERPKVSLLKRLNWYTEDAANQPSIMHIPIKDANGNSLNVRRGDLIKIPNNMNTGEDDVFQVSIVKTGLVPMTFICNVVPYRKPIESLSEPTLNNKWLDVS